METFEVTLRKWGDSLGMTLPFSLRESLGLSAGDKLILTATDEGFTVATVKGEWLDDYRTSDPIVDVDTGDYINVGGSQYMVLSAKTYHSQTGRALCAPIVGQAGKKPALADGAGQFILLDEIETVGLGPTSEKIKKLKMKCNRAVLKEVLNRVSEIIAR